MGVECIHEQALVPTVALQHLLQVALVAGVQRGGQQLLAVPLFAPALARQIHFKKLVQVDLGILQDLVQVHQVLGGVGPHGALGTFGITRALEHLQEGAAAGFTQAGPVAIGQPLEELLHLDQRCIHAAHLLFEVQPLGIDLVQTGGMQQVRLNINRVAVGQRGHIRLCAVHQILQGHALAVDGHFHLGPADVFQALDRIHQATEVLDAELLPMRLLCPVQELVRHLRHDALRLEFALQPVPELHARGHSVASVQPVGDVVLRQQLVDAVHIVGAQGLGHRQLVELLQVLQTLLNLGFGIDCGFGQAVVQERGALSLNGLGGISGGGGQCFLTRARFSGEVHPGIQLAGALGGDHLLGHLLGGLGYLVGGQLGLGQRLQTGRHESGARLVVHGLVGGLLHALRVGQLAVFLEHALVGQQLDCILFATRLHDGPSHRIP